MGRLAYASPELSRVRAFSEKLLTIPDHRFRESRQMAPGDSFATPGPTSSFSGRPELRQDMVMGPFILASVRSSSRPFDAR